MLSLFFEVKELQYNPKGYSIVEAYLWNKWVLSRKSDAVVDGESGESRKKDDVKCARWVQRP